MPNISLDERKREILKALITTHIATGEPVGSECLALQFRHSLSSASIRIVLAELERLGYLEQPHTSAGRVPTDEGYRLYVNHLMNQKPLSAKESGTIRSLLALSQGCPNEALVAAAQILSRLSGKVGFVLAPEMSRTSFKHIDLVKLPHPRILVVMVTQAGYVANRVIEVQEEITQTQLQSCANYLNLHFVGLTLHAIRAQLLELMREDKARYQVLLQHVIQVGQQAFSLPEAANDVYVDGASHLLERVELPDLERMHAVFKTFEERSRLVRILTACMAGNGVRIVIGQENPDPDLRAMSMVTASYGVSERPDWGLGVMGSTRMEYPRIIALVDRVAQCVHRVLSEPAV